MNPDGVSGTVASPKKTANSTNQGCYNVPDRVSFDTRYAGKPVPGLRVT